MLYNSVHYLSFGKALSILPPVATSPYYQLVALNTPFTLFMCEF